MFARSVQNAKFRGILGLVGVVRGIVGELKFGVFQSATEGVRIGWKGVGFGYGERAVVVYREWENTFLAMHLQVITLRWYIIPIKFKQEMKVFHNDN